MVNLIVPYADSLSGDATFGNIVIGQDAGTLNEVPGVAGPSGGFGQQADTVTIDNLRQNTWLTTAVGFHPARLRPQIRKPLLVDGYARGRDGLRRVQPGGAANPPDQAGHPGCRNPGCRSTGCRSTGPGSAWQAFRDWRRSRPFWGGLLLLLAGLELIAIPLLSVKPAHGSVKVVIYIGIGGVFGVLIGGLLVACGLLDLVSSGPAGLLRDRPRAAGPRVVRRHQPGRVLRRHAARRDRRLAQLRVDSRSGPGDRPASSPAAAHRLPPPRAWGS